MNIARYLPVFGFMVGSDYYHGVNISTVVCSFLCPNDPYISVHSGIPSLVRVRTVLGTSNSYTPEATIDTSVGGVIGITNFPFHS